MLIQTIPRRYEISSAYQSAIVSKIFKIFKMPLAYGSVTVLWQLVPRVITLGLLEVTIDVIVPLALILVAVNRGL